MLKLYYSSLKNKCVQIVRKHQNLYKLYQVALRYPILILGRTSRHKCCAMFRSTQVRRLNVHLPPNAITFKDCILVSMMLLLALVVVSQIVLVNVVGGGAQLAGPHLNGVNWWKTTTAACRSAGVQFTRHSHAIPNNAQDDSEFDQRHCKSGGQKPDVLLAIPGV